MPKKGGKTTVSPGGLIKKSFWFHPDEVARLRRAAFEEETSQAELVRRAVRQFFDMGEPGEPDSPQALSEEIRSDPRLRKELRDLLSEHTDDPAQVEELMSVLESAGDKRAD